MAKFRFRFRLTIYILSVTLLVLIGLGFVIGQLFNSFYFDHLTDRMEKETEMLAYIVSGAEFEQSEKLQEIVVEVSEKLEARVTLIQTDGTVIAESHADPATMDNHLLRPEVQETLQDGEGHEIRYSDTLKAELLYYALPLYMDTELIGFVRLGVPIKALSDVTKNLWSVLVVSISMAFFVIVSVTYRITNQMIGPIEEATRVANALTDGDFKARTVEGREDEVGQLSRSINVLAYNLDQVTRRHQIQQERMETLIENMGSGLIFISTRGDITLINKSCRDIFQENTDKWLNRMYHEVIVHKEIIKIVQDIFLTEKRQRKQVKLAFYLEVRHFDVYGAPIMSEEGKLKGIALVFHDITELKKLEQVRKDFVANVSHELKTPVTSIKGFSETLLDGAMEEKELREKFLTIIWKESERLQSLIHDLLELSRIEQQYFKLNWQKTNVAEIIEEVVLLLKGKAEEKEIMLEYRVEGDLCIDGDPTRIRQIIINLITNGLTYTPAGGFLYIEAVPFAEESIEIKIQDSGIGISEQELPRIFERFYRVDKARSRNSGGTGLGLAIVKHLVEAHHGKIHVESTVGKGTTFFIRLNKQVAEIE
ncbi:ATP-binding protein [Alkalihalobacillus sp. LMS39]|uniref:two-component system histidine kinase PnpS n=1 Tax=Alkalihalobacillus sp. LMS39 TaxID=2924032 RepID=UPI001FB23A1E|nr:ATP-binding protein [Alkalihalobacillus sp. LMS39]UOE93414.1 ATP-binding protein [Alkalihalobacillus sp. LMS39]